MDVEWQPEAIVRAKLDQLKKEFFEYVEKNIGKIEANVPVFYGHVIATLEKVLPGVSDELHDRFIDSITIKVLDTSSRSSDTVFVEKLFDYALRNKRKKTGKALFDITLGMKLITSGKYVEAIEQLKKYRTVDASICPAIAYCYFVLSTQAGPNQDLDGSVRRPTQSSLTSREQMIELVRLKPPVNRIKDLDVPENAFTPKYSYVEEGAKVDVITVGDVIVTVAGKE